MTSRFSEGDRVIGNDPEWKLRGKYWGKLGTVRRSVPLETSHPVQQLLVLFDGENKAVPVQATSLRRATTREQGFAIIMELTSRRTLFRVWSSALDLKDDVTVMAWDGEVLVLSRKGDGQEIDLDLDGADYRIGVLGSGPFLEIYQNDGSLILLTNARPRLSAIGAPRD